MFTKSKPMWSMESRLRLGGNKTNRHILHSKALSYIHYFIWGIFFWKQQKKNLCTSVYVFRKRIFKLGISPWESLHNIIQPTKHTARLVIRKFQVRFLPRDVFFSKNYLWLNFTIDLLPSVHKRNERTIVQR